MEQTNASLRPQGVSLLCFIFFSLSTLGLITTAMGRTSFVPTNETDRKALLAIKDLIPGDPFLVFHSWNDSIHFCDWQGITCNHRHHQRVSALNLLSLGMVGSVSPHIGNLTFLRIIDLSNNSFRGQIPPEIGRLFRLKYLWLSDNSFQGELPINLTRCSRIESLDLGSNQLGGRIPSTLGSLPKLSEMSLAKNQLIGTIPPSLGNLSTLSVLYLLFNNLEGSIPLELAQLSDLEILSLSFNNLTGIVPSSLYNMSSISYFSVSANLLHGSLPPDMGFTLPHLRQFYAAANQFNGPIPSSLANASGLYIIDIGENSFTGPLPMNFGVLSRLKRLSIFGNKLGGSEGNELMEPLTSLSNCSNLIILDLSQNLFKGMLPHAIANLSHQMDWFTVDSNYISGSIPPGIGNLVSLSALFLSENMLTGRIPDSMGKLSKLEELLLDTNRISGDLPSSFGNLTRLGILNLTKNMIEGSIPNSLANCTNLLGIHLGFNHLTGAIPQQIFSLSSLVVLFLHQNYLTEALPLQVGNMKNLGTLAVSDNKLSGEIPATLGSCQVLEFLHMKNNLFEGKIPPSFQQLKGIQFLDISLNNLSGQIPQFLGELHFQYLNLSYNSFDGEVPNEGAFTNISAFSVVGNKQLCGGIEVLKLPRCLPKVLKERKQPFGHRVIALLVILPVVLLVMCALAIFYRIRRSRMQLSSALPLQNQFLQLSYWELLQATNGFTSANLIGKGRFGSVYKGILNSDEQSVAVKVLNLDERGGNKSFVAECQALKNLRHRNLVKVITSCSSIDFKGNDFKALVFEFMENGNLESWLHPSLLEHQKPKSLNFVQRLNIAIDVASAMDYLHHHCEMAFIHCDLKPSNILLDDDFCAHVSDFGMARILLTTTRTSSQQQSSSIGIRGTIGYVAPEYGLSGLISTQCDIYSYGVLLLEMFTGKRPIENMFSDDISLHSYTKKSIPYRVTEIVDPRITLEEEEKPNVTKLEVCLVSVLQIGVSCSSELPNERMSARDVLMELCKIRTYFLG